MNVIIEKSDKDANKKRMLAYGSAMKEAEKRNKESKKGEQK